MRQEILPLTFTNRTNTKNKVKGKKARKHFLPLFLLFTSSVLVC